MAKKDGDFYLIIGPTTPTRGELNTIFQNFHEYFSIDVANEGIASDIISEKTPGTGVTADGVLMKDSEVTTNVINEKTSGSGVTADGVLLKDSTVKTNTIIEKTSAAGVTIDGTKLKDGGIILGSAGQTVSTNVVEYSAEVAISAANIIAMNGSAVEVVAAVSGSSIEFVSAVLIYDYDTATYGGGGSVTLEYSGGAAVTTTIVKTNSFAATGDKVFSFAPLNAAGGYTMPVNTALDITNATGAFTDPGTAAGVGRLHITYRVHTTGL